MEPASWFYVMNITKQFWRHRRESNMALLNSTFLLLSFLSIFVSGAVLPHTSPKLVARKDWEGLAYTWLYQFPLPIPPVKAPKMLGHPKSLTAHIHP